MAAGQLFIIEVGIPNASKVNVPIYFPDNAPNVRSPLFYVFVICLLSQDFPLAIEVSTKYSVMYLLTKEGYFHLYDLGAFFMLGS